MKTRFFLCTSCGNVIVKTIDSGVDVVCCGKEMQELVPNEAEGMGEKHLPVVECTCDGTVNIKVGSAPHPMSQEHHIMFIYLETEHGGHLRYLKLDKPANICFHIGKEKPIAVYSYCNIHGMWRTQL